MPTGLPPAPPPSPSTKRIKAGGLVSGTGRLKHVKRRQIQIHRQPSPPPPPPQQQQPSIPLTPREQFAQYYGFTLPPPPPTQEDPDAGYPYESQAGIIKPRHHFPASIVNSSSSSSTSSNSSSDRWSSSAYSQSPHSAATSVRPSPPPPQFRRSSARRPSSTVPSHPLPLDHDDLLARFNDQFVHSRTQSACDAPTSPSKRERSIIPPGAEGKLLVPDVKLKVRCSSSASIESAAFRRTPSRSSPLSAPCSVHEFNKQQVFTSLTLKRPSFETRAWSYDNVPTYPIMRLPPKTETHIVKQIVDGKEMDVEHVVEVHEEPKKLFLFAPKVVLR